MTSRLRALALRGAALACVAASVVPGAASAAGDPAAGHDRHDRTGPLASEIFVAVIAKRTPQNRRRPAVALDLRVVEPLSGDLERGADARVVTTKRFQRRCSATIRTANRRTRLLFGAVRQENTLVVDDCGDVIPASAANIRAVKERLRNREPDPEPTPAPEPVPVNFRTAPAGSAMAFGRTAAPGLAVVIAGFLGLVLVRRVGRRR